MIKFPQDENNYQIMQIDLPNDLLFNQEEYFQENGDNIYDKSIPILIDSFFCLSKKSLKYSDLTFYEQRKQFSAESDYKKERKKRKSCSSLFQLELIIEDKILMIIKFQMKVLLNCLIRFSDQVEQFPHILVNEFLSFNFSKKLNNEENERKKNANIHEVILEFRKIIIKILEDKKLKNENAQIQQQQENQEQIVIAYYFQNALKYFFYRKKKQIQISENLD